MSGSFAERQRRAVLGREDSQRAARWTLGALVASCMACASDDESEPHSNTEATEPTEMTSPSDSSAEETSAADGPNQDQTGAIYANVTGVVASGTSGAYTFAVTIESSDIDCSQFADWWEVLRDDGTLLYRRILTHSHTDENGTTDADAPGNSFTRCGGSVDASADEVIIVRAHMNNAGYAGEVMRGSVDAGFLAVSDVEASFAAGVEEQPPHPGECLF